MRIFLAGMLSWSRIFGFKHKKTSEWRFFHVVSLALELVKHVNQEVIVIIVLYDIGGFSN